MAQIVNLNRARKAKRRAGAAAQADANRAAFGRSKAERAAAKVAAARVERELNGAKRE